MIIKAFTEVHLPCLNIYTCIFQLKQLRKLKARQKYLQIKLHDVQSGSSDQSLLETGCASVILVLLFVLGCIPLSEPLDCFLTICPSPI